MEVRGVKNEQLTAGQQVAYGDQCHVNVFIILLREIDSSKTEAVFINFRALGKSRTAEKNSRAPKTKQRPSPSHNCSGALLVS